MLANRFISRFLPLGIAMAVALAGNLSAQTPDAGEDIRGPKPLIAIPVPEKPP